MIHYSTHTYLMPGKDYDTLINHTYLMPGIDY